MLLLVSAALAEAWTPLRVALECQSERRVDLCTLIQGSLDNLPVVKVVPRSDAAVVLYLNATSESFQDFVLMRAVLVGTSVPGAPASFEQPIAVDYRIPVDEQRAALDPVLHRVLSPYLALAVPGAVTVTLTAPEGEEDTSKKGSPWSFSVWGGGWGSWSEQYRSLSLWTGFSLGLETDISKASFWVGYDRSIELQPSLVVGSTEVELTSDSSSLSGAFKAGRNLSDRWTVGGLVRGGGDDPEGQYLATTRAHLGVEHNWFPSDDPRGNRLSVSALVGGQGDWYNTRNTLGQKQAFFPTAMLVGSGELRIDRVALGADLSARAQLWPFFDRYLFSGAVDSDLTIGDHVDLSLRVEATQQAIPGPAELDESDYEEVTRASYAQPLEVWGHFNLRFHWDATNAARNNRLDAWGDLGTTDGL